MDKPNLKNLFHDLQNQMISKLTTNRRWIDHPGIKGDASELNWVEWLKTYLPKRYCVDKASIIDSENNVSQQIDVVIYDQQYCPFVFNQNSAIYIPAESVYAVFEVKQDLNKKSIEYAGEKAKSVRMLKRTSVPIPHAGGCYPAKQHNKILSGILTLSSTWADPLGERFTNCIEKLPEDQKIDMGCALQYGAFNIKYFEEKIEIKKSTPEEAFIYFFLVLLMELQKLGTIPAIDIEAYCQVLDSI